MFRYRQNHILPVRRTKATDEDLEISESEIQAAMAFTAECIPEEPDEKDADDVLEREIAQQYESTVKHEDLYDYGKSCLPEEDEEDESIPVDERVNVSSARPLTVVFPVVEREGIDGVQPALSEKPDDIKETKTSPITDDLASLEKEIASGYQYDYESDDSLQDEYQEGKDVLGKDASQKENGHFLAETSDSVPFFVETLNNEDTLLHEVSATEKDSQSEGTVYENVAKEKTPEKESDSLSSHSEISSGHPELSQDDIGDTSSVESFTTVVPADQEEENEDAENRLDDFASMTSSCHSDVMGTTMDDDHLDKDAGTPIIDWNQKEIIEFEEKTRKESEQERLIKARNQQIEEEALQKKFEELRMIKSEKDHTLIDWEEGSESSLESDRYEYIDKNALSIITEISDEDKFELMDTDDLKSETMSERPYGSPEDFPPPSPGITSFRGGKSAEKDDISVTSSLLEFERLEHEIDQSGSRGSIENADKDSLGGSLDERQFMYNKSADRDDISITSSLAEFERLERELAQSSSASSVEKITPDSGSRSSDVEGSKSSLGDVEKLDRDSPGGGPERKSSVEGMLRRSEMSSLASLTEFERLEQEILLADELEAEAQKIVSILESGALISDEPITTTAPSLTTYHVKKTPVDHDDIDKDSIEDKDEPEDSLSDGKLSTKKDDVDHADADSLDGDVSEINSMTSSVILNQKVGKEEDSSLRDEESMKISSDSLGEELGVKIPKDKDKFDTDSLQDHEGIMERSVDSLEGEKKSSKEDDKMDTDSLCGQDDIMQRSGEDVMQRSGEDVMQTSADSLDNFNIVKTHESTMESSMYSVDSSIFSRSSAETMRSAGSHHSDSSTEIMRVSAESYDEKRRKEKQWLIDNYHSYRQSGHGFIDQEGNITASELKSFKIEDNYGYGWDEDLEDDESPDKKAFSWGPYEEKKKVFTMAEWEAMKEEKRRASLAKTLETDEREQEVEITETTVVTSTTTTHTKSESKHTSSVTIKSTDTYIETETLHDTVQTSSDKHQQDSPPNSRMRDADDTTVSGINQHCMACVLICLLLA